MAKIPVGATIARAYRFAFRDFFKILGVVWLPWAILSAGGFLIVKRVMALSVAVTGHDYSAIGSSIAVVVPFYILMFILLCMQMIGIAQLALGRREGPAWVYFSIGRPLWRLIGSFLLLVVALIVGYFAALLATVLLAFLNHSVAKMIPGAAMVLVFLLGIAAIALWCGYIYSVFRLTFLLTPVIAADEEGFALERAWALGKGNFWRMFAIFLALIVPFLVLEGVVLFGFVWHGLPPMLPPHATPDQLAAFSATMQAQNTAMIGRMYHYWYLNFPIFGVLTVLFYGLGTGSQAFAYQAAMQQDAAPNLLSDLR